MSLLFLVGLLYIGCGPLPVTVANEGLWKAPTKYVRILVQAMHSCICKLDHCCYASFVRGFMGSMQWTPLAQEAVWFRMDRLDSSLSLAYFARSMKFLLVFARVSYFSMHQSTLSCSPGPLLNKGLYHGLDALTKTGRSMWTTFMSNMAWKTGVPLRMVFFTWTRLPWLWKRENNRIHTGEFRVESAKGILTWRQSLTNHTHKTTMT